MGRSASGFKFELKLNDYTINTELGRISSNNYMVASSVSFNLFGEPSSWGYLTRIQTWEDASAVSNAQKNSVNSFYIRYPMPIQGLYLTAEYAHSTYYRPGFNLLFSGESTDYNWNDHFQKWIRIDEIATQDESFFFLFDLKKGPLSIFPLGYVRLGPKFVSRYLGLPGFSIEDFGIEVLPVTLQSMEVFVLRGDIKKLEDNYKDEFIYVTGGETEPMFLDTSARATSCGVVIIIAPVAWASCESVSCTSPVPGGRSIIR